MRRLSLYLLLFVALFGATGCPQEPEGQPPVITLPDGKIYTVELGESITLSPVFDHLTEGTTITWLSDGKPVGTGKTFTFTPSEAGVFYFTVEAVNQFGKAFAEVRIEVRKPEDPTPPDPTPPDPPEPTPQPVDTPLFVFDQAEYHVAVGRTIRLLPLDLDSTRHYTFTWQIDGSVRQEGEQPLFRFEATAQGTFHVDFRATDGEHTADTTLTVVVCPPEGTYRRKAASTSSPNAAKVYSYLPAPGQYVNENYTALTPEEACDYAMNRMKQGYYVSLGGFGGSLVVGFDHSI